MRAAVLAEAGAIPEAADFDDPEAGDGEVVVDLVAAGMNPVDRIIAGGEMFDREFPNVAGLEGIGRDGDRLVYFGAPREPFGSFAERVPVKVDETYEVPDGVDPQLALAFGIAGQAAWLGLDWRGGLREGESVLILGASSAVGQIGVQAAKLLGASRVVATARKQEDLDRAAQLGADAGVITEGSTGDIREAIGAEAGDGFDVILDPLWGDPGSAALAHIAQGGRFVHIGNSAGAEATFVGPELRRKQASILGHVNFAASDDVKRDAFQTMCRHAADGNLTMEIEAFSLDRVKDMWEAQAEGPHRKLVLVP